MFLLRAARMVVASLLLTGLLVTAAAAAENRTSPQAAQKFMQDLADRTMALLKNYKSLDHDKARADFQAILRDGFDLDVIGHFVLGNAWRNAPPDRQQEYMKLFSVYVLDTYARRLGTYEGEIFKISGASPMTETDALVDSQIERPEGAAIRVGWRVRDVGGRLKIMDVIVEGVSMVLTQRQEFDSVLQRGGIDLLLHELRDRVSKLRSAKTN